MTSQPFCLISSATCYASSGFKFDTTILAPKVKRVRQQLFPFSFPPTVTMAVLFLRSKNDFVST